MKKLRQWMNRQSIKRKLIFYSYMILGPLLAVISALLCIRTYRLEKGKLFSEQRQNVQSASESVEEYLNGIREYGTYIQVNYDIEQLLTSEYAAWLNADGQVWKHRAPMKILQDMMALSGSIKTIAIYPENGLRPYMKCMDSTSCLPFADVKKTAVYKTACTNGGRRIWRRVGKHRSDTYLASYTDKLVMYREMYNLSRQRALGYLVIGASMERIEQIGTNMITSPQEAALIVSGEGQVLYQAGRLKPQMLRAVIADTSVHGEAYVYRKNWVFHNTDKTSGITVYKLVPKDLIKERLFNLAITPVWILLVFLVGLLPILNLISALVCKPLQRLCVEMDYFRKGDFNRQLPVTSGDEVGQVAACFNKMVTDMSVLIEKNYVMVLRERESELNLLQAQINPHFIYNTLDTLYWKAVGAGNDEIGEDILSLSQLFRLVLARGREIVSVSDEQKLLEAYLHVQKMRFSERLEYQIELEQEILSCEIPKLILQPFVENAIVHGFEEGQKECFVAVIGYRKEQWLVLQVIDTGVGMDEKQLAAIWKEDVNSRHAAQKIGHYAIKNVRERLELKYRDRFVLTVESKKGEGTKVTIQIPYE